MIDIDHSCFEEVQKYKDKYKNIYGITDAQSGAILETFDDMPKKVIRWNNPAYRKADLSRTQYNAIVRMSPKKSGYYSKLALERKKKGKKNCSDHVYAPQVYSYFIFDCWNELFENDLDRYYHDMVMLMTTIEVAPKENDKLRSCTLNNEDTNYKLKLMVGTKYRYEEVEISLIGEKVKVPLPPIISSKNISTKFPWGLQPDFEEYERKNLIID